jgi:hypothetical protein
VPHIGSLLRDDIAAVIGQSDVLVVGLDGSRIAAALVEHVRDDQFVLDLMNLPVRERLRGHYCGLCW